VVLISTELLAAQNYKTSGKAANSSLGFCAEDSGAQKTTCNATDHQSAGSTMPDGLRVPPNGFPGVWSSHMKRGCNPPPVDACKVLGLALLALSVEAVAGDGGRARACHEAL
jgi:hypothetical protein